MSDYRTAAAYIRVSTDDQTELSPDSQLSAIRDYASNHAYAIPEEHIYVDEGISGRTAAKRPAFNRMIAAAKDTGHPFDCILVWKFSRFARNQEESVVYKAMLRKDRVEVISVSEPLIEGPFGGLIERILEWMDEYYSIRLSGEVKRSMTLNAQRGVRQIAPPFGYRLESRDGKRVMLPEPREAALVREMFRRFLAGEGTYAIARRMNSMDARTHRGNPFEQRTVEYILRNPVYVGKMRWTPTGRVRRDFSNPDTIVTDAGHEPLIDSGTWNTAQERIKARKEMWGRKARPACELKDWLGGVVRCAACGTTLIFTKPHYFKCNNYVRGRCRESQHIRVDLLHDALLGRLRDDLSGARALDYQIFTESNGGGEAEIRRLKAALDALERKLSRVRDSYAAGVDSLEEYRKYRADIDKEKARLLERLTDFKTRQDSKQKMSLLRERLKQAVGILESPDIGKELKNSVLRSMVASCEFDKKRMTLQIVYRVVL
ncbi:MAG: recombinase family protein [Oscillibacter sp.]|nr:recombinase family protein [Oscillibacter sp.]